MRNFRVRGFHIICLAIATAEILIVAFVLWNDALRFAQTAKERTELSETKQEDTNPETTKQVNENPEMTKQEDKNQENMDQENSLSDEDLTNQELSMRVKLKNSDGTSYEHDEVVISCADTFHIQSGTKEQIFTGGQTITITLQHPFFKEGSVRVASEGSALVIDSILRRGESHDYEGVLDLYPGSQGIIVVNELPLEAYVSRVVPSEMPVSYGIEAAKLQAVCARTYAYERILHQKTIDGYGSYADDSVEYQVYNSAGYQAVSAEATAQTRGIIMVQGGAPIVPYYFSTSCGYTCDNLAWSGNEALPYLTSLNLTGEEERNMTDEETVCAFLQDWDAPGLESDMAWYRWRCEISMEKLQELFAVRLRELSAEQSICVQAAGDTLENIVNSKLCSVQVTGRFQGGMAAGVQLVYEAGQVNVTGELVIRKLLSEPTRTYRNKSQEQIALSEGNYLPSAFFCLIPTKSGEEITGYIICGGGNGHGIGLSQNAAYMLLNQGKNWQEILAFFYQGIAFDVIS